VFAPDFDFREPLGSNRVRRRFHGMHTDEELIRWM
jgi:hypothetical protein